jgi:type IV pilus biogenesis protein CpaD/CtpE
MSKPLSRLAALLASALALAACEAQPIGPGNKAEFSENTVQRDFYFQRGGAELADGEAVRLAAFLDPLRLRPQDSAQVYIGPTGSPELDAARVAAMTAAFAGVPARLQVISSPELAQGWPNAAVVLVNRNGMLVVTCPNNALNTWERDYLTPMPPVGCTNALNLALMAERPRDLTSPRVFGGTPASASVAAVDRFRADKVKVIQLDDMATGN